MKRNRYLNAATAAIALTLGVLTLGACASDAGDAIAADAPTDNSVTDDITTEIELTNRRLDLRNIPGQHVAAWDAMFANETERAETLLADLITDDATITFKFPDGDLESPPGTAGWIAIVTQSGAAGGWVPAGPDLPLSLHNAGSVNILFETDTDAELRAYVRASHYTNDTTVDISEGIFDFDVTYVDGQGWRISHLDLTPLLLREEGGAALGPVTE